MAKITRCIIILMLGLFMHSTIQAQENPPKFWLWVHGNKNFKVEQWDSVFQKLSKAGITGVLMGGGKEQLEIVVPIAEKHSLEVHAWFWTMNNRSAKSEWLSVNRNGESLADKKAYVGYYKFMCPALPEVRNFIDSNINELLSVKGLKGIHMDYVRYVDVILPIAIQPKYNIVQDHEFPEFDYGYHPYMRELYKEKHGTDPMDIKDPENDLQWKQFRYNKLNEAIELINQNIDQKQSILSAAVFPTPDIARKLVRQDWDKWPLDYVFPMIYHNFYNKKINWIKQAVKEGKKSLPKETKLYCGLYIPAISTPGDLTKAMNNAFKGGANGIAFFDFRALKDFHWEEIEEFVRGMK